MYGLGPVHPDDRNNPFRYRIDSHRSGWARLILIALAAVIGLGVWFFNGGSERKTDDVPLIRADQGQTKTKPDEPGGMEIPNQDKLVYDEGKGPKVEQLLPPPEAPLPPPVAAAPPPAPAAAPPVLPPAPVVAANPAPAATQPPARIAAQAPKPVPAPAPAPVAVAKPAKLAALPPPVPAAAPAPAPAAAPVAGGYRLQLAAVPSEALGQSEWTRIRTANADLLGALGVALPRADLGAKGIFYRVQAGPIAEAGEAQRICNALKQRNVGCILVKP